MEFLNELARGMDADSRLILCGFQGDPNDIGKEAWRPRQWRPGRPLPWPSTWNGYTTVAAFRQAADGSWRRRKETFVAGLALMVDDVGTKVDPKKVEHMQASAIVETSPGNFQHWFFFDQPLADEYKFGGLIKAFIDQALAGNDPGMAGVTRVGRIPGYTNGKAKYGGWTVELRELSGRRYSVAELIDGFRLVTAAAHSRRPPSPSQALMKMRVNAWREIVHWLNLHGITKADDFDAGGWMEITCPWIEDHTAAADTGAAIAVPSDENGFYGGFRCHHGHCADKGWNELTQWVNEQAVEQLDLINQKG